MKITKFLTLAALLAAGCASAPKSQTAVYLNPSKPVEERIEDALSRMTTREKIGLIHAQSKFSSAGVPRLGLPEVWCTDGPHGIRPEVLWDEWDQAGWTNDSCTAFPALTCLAATWNPDMSALYGKSIGEEARYREKDVLLGPGVNIYRTPLNGRNFEYMGEDPYLASKMVVPYIEGVQRNGVAACVKHFALNNQETDAATSTSSSTIARSTRFTFRPSRRLSRRAEHGPSWEPTTSIKESTAATTNTCSTTFSNAIGISTASSYRTGAAYTTPSRPFATDWTWSSAAGPTV